MIPSAVKTLVTSTSGAAKRLAGKANFSAAAQAAAKPNPNPEIQYTGVSKPDIYFLFKYIFF